MIIYNAISVLALAWVWAAGFAQTTNPSKLKNDLQKYLTVIHAKRSFSGEIPVARGDNIIFWEPIGLASVETGTPIKTGMNYRIASITKRPHALC